MSSENEMEKVASSRDLEATHMLDGVFYNHLKQKVAPVFGDPNQIRILTWVLRRKINVAFNSGAKPS